MNYRFMLGGVLLVVVLVVANVARGQGATTIFVDHEKGNDASGGTDAAHPLKTFRNATTRLKPGTVLHIAPTTRPYTEPLVLRISGEPDRPIVVEGNGATIDLGTDLSDGPWKQERGEWVLEKAVDPPPAGNRAGWGQAAALFVDDLPVYFPPASQTGPLKPGQLRFDEQNRLRVVSTEGKRPGGTGGGGCRIVRPRGIMQTSGVAINASHLTVRNLTAKFAGNDGFNLHGHHTGVRLENVKAFYNGDEGISAHETFSAIVENAEIAYNGSVSGGVADVNASVTVYRHCLVHHNRAAFHFDAEGKHEIYRTVTFDNGRPVSGGAAGTRATGRELPEKPAANVTIRESVSLAAGIVPDPREYPEGIRALVERAAEIRRRELQAR